MRTTTRRCAACLVTLSSLLLPACCFGGPCAYEAYDGQCKLAEVKEVDRSGGTVTLNAHYESTPRFGARGDVEMSAPESEAAALRTHMESYKTLPCKGQIITKGSCSPGPVTLTMPPFAGKK